MTQKAGTSKIAADKLIQNIRRKTRATYSAEENIRIVLAVTRGLSRPSALKDIVWITDLFVNRFCPKT